MATLFVVVMPASLLVIRALLRVVFGAALPRVLSKRLLLPAAKFVCATLTAQIAIYWFRALLLHTIIVLEGIYSALKYVNNFIAKASIVLIGFLLIQGIPFGVLLPI